MKLTLERQIPLGFVIAIFLLAITIFFAFRSMNSLNETLRLEKHTQEVLLQLDEIFVSMLNAETGSRGFMITQDETIIEPYNQAKRNIVEDLAKLHNLITDNPNQVQRVTRLEDLSNQRISLLGQMIEARRTKSLEEVRERFRQSGGREQSERVRQLINEIKSEEENLLAEREAALNSSLTTSYIMLFAVGLAGIISLGLANMAIYREIGKRRQAEENLRDTNKDLETRVEERTREVTEKNEELSEQIVRREQTEKEREEILKKEKLARREAEIANRLRDEFLATVSHELRAPLNSILGWGKLLEKEILDQKTVQKAVETIVRNAEAQNRLIEDLLDVSRIISGKLRLEISPIRPIDVIEAALETVRPAADAKGITLEVRSLSPVSHISGDPNRLQQVIWNLLSNAIKFTPNGGRVTVELERANGDVEIRVIDTGIGIKEDFLPYVFDRFRQADASSIRQFGGLGLGLAIVRHIVEMHGGTVVVSSEGENKGTTFTIKIPVITTPQVLEGDKTNEIIAESAPPNAQQITLDGLLILVVDDEEDTRHLLIQSLTLYGATVISARSADEGLRELKDKNPDILVSDIGMPDEDGYGLIKKIRALADEHQKNTPAIALTGFTRAQDRMKAMTCGYQTHLSKPVEPDELATVIASLTGRLRMEEGD